MSTIGAFPAIQGEGRRLGKDGLMPLSREEQRVLDSIEDGLRVHDPEFAAKWDEAVAEVGLGTARAARTFTS